eukprot:351849-Chlamydomonas_euryale.AAC.6
MFDSRRMCPGYSSFSARGGGETSPMTRGGKASAGREYSALTAQGACLAAFVMPTFPPPLHSDTVVLHWLFQTR